MQLGISSFLCKQGLRDGEIGNILAKIEQGCEELEEKSLPHEEISTEYNSKKRKQDDKVHANSQDSEKKLREDVITSTNTFVDELYGNRIVKLDTSCLFGEENWEGIIKIFKLAADGQSSVPEATKKMIQGFYTICEDIGLGNLDQEFKLLILETLNTTSIHFDLYKADEQVIDNISATITRQMKEEETRNVLNQQEGLYIIDKLNKVILGLENQSKLKDNNYQIRLDPQIYHLQFRAIIIDVDREKCPVDYEFHEKIHLLDNNLLEGSLTCSAQALSHFNLDDDDKKVILENLIIKICQGFDKKHYIDTLYNAANGIEATACEVLAFALQKKALNPEFYKDKNFSLKEIKVMISIVDCFKNNISKKYPEMTGLTDLCQEFIDELNIKNSQPSLSPDILFAEQLEKFDQHQK